jgi:transposase
MLNLETQAQIRHWFYAEHWKVGTIARELSVHPDAVRRALQNSSCRREPALRPCLTDPYVEFVRATLQSHPRLRATRIFQMVRDRGYPGSIVQLRRLVARLRPVGREAFLRLTLFPGQEAQADWAHFGEVRVGRARRRLSCFLITLSYSRALY